MSFLFGKVLEAFGNRSHAVGNVSVAEFCPHVVALVEQHFLLLRHAMVVDGGVVDDVILNVEQVVYHRLVGQLVHDWRDWIVTAVDDDKLRLVLVRPLAHFRIVGFVSVQFALRSVAKWPNQGSKSWVRIVSTDQSQYYNVYYPFVNPKLG